MPWHAGRKQPGLQHCKLWQQALMSAFRCWTGGMDGSYRWWRFAGIGTSQLLSPPGEHQSSAQTSRVVRTEEGNEWLLAVKGAFPDFATSSYTSGIKPRRESNRPAALISVAVSSGSNSAAETTPEGTLGGGYICLYIFHL